MTYNLVAGKLYTNTYKDYPVVFIRNQESFFTFKLEVSQIYLDLGCILLYTGKAHSYTADGVYRSYEFLYHTKIIHIRDIPQLKEIIT